MKLQYALLATLVFIAQPLTADVVKIGVSQQGQTLSETKRPQNGMEKQDVERLFGAPMEAEGPVGEPAITTWTYKDFTVYYENDTVLHSVLRHASQQ